MSTEKNPRWRDACSASDLDDEEMVECSVDGHELLLVRTDDVLVACPARCPHMDEPLSLGIVDGCVLTCTKHMWQWNLETGKPMGPAELPLTVAPVRIEGGRVLVDLAVLEQANEAAPDEGNR